MNPDQFDDADLLLVPEVVMLPDGPVRDHAVLVSDGQFTEIGPADKVVAAHPELNPIRMDGHLLMPGFVDAHHHLTQSFGKSLAFGEPSEIFRRIWVPLEAELTEESAYLAAKLSALESLRGGFTTVTEAGTRSPVDVSVVATAAEHAGIRCVLGRVCRTEGEGNEHLSRDHNTLIHPSLAIPIPEAATPEVLRAVSGLCAESGAVFQIHVNEHLASVERSLETHGRRPLQHLSEVGALGPQTLAAHATMLTPDEVRLLAESGAAISYNPVASAWKGNAVAPANLMSAMGVRLGLGTDGTRGDAFRLLDIAELAQRLAFGLPTGDSSCGGGWTWWEHATSRGADAVGLGEVTGRIEVGKAADFLVLDLQVPEMRPSWDLTWELVRLANRDQITAVVVDGRLRLWRGWPTRWDGRALLEEAAKVGREVVRRAPVQRVHPPSMEHRRCDR